MRPVTGRTVIVENKPGAGGHIATQYIVKAKPDGYYILIHAGNTLDSNQNLIAKNTVDAGKQIQIAATINRQAFMLVVDAKKPWKTMGRSYRVPESKRATRAPTARRPIPVSSCARIYKERAGLQSVDVSYKMGQDMLNDMASGNVDFSCTDPVFALSQQREGHVRILAVASGARLKATPEIPTMAEQGYAMDLVGWFSAMVPAATPRPIVNQINSWFAKIHAMPETAKFLTNFGGDPWIATPEEGQARLLKDIKDWERLRPHRQSLNKAAGLN